MAVQSNADTKKNAQAILDPKSPELEPEQHPKLSDQIGDSYATDEALQQERDANQKLAADKLKKEQQKTDKVSDHTKTPVAAETRSAIDPTHTSVVHPGALDSNEVKPSAK